MDEVFPTAFFAFFVFWVLLGIGGIAFFYGCRDAKLKRRQYPRWGVFAMFCICIFAAWELGPTILIVLVPWCAFTYYVTTHTTEFCDNCGASLINTHWFAKERFCPRCGANLLESARDKGRNP
ncbi:MAG TPA: hypothetical protein VGK58_09865 [Lacipirellulaceae bacterium]